MEFIFLSLTLAGIFVFGFYIVDLFGKFLDESRRERYHYPPKRGKKSAHLTSGKVFHWRS